MASDQIRKLHSMTVYSGGVVSTPAQAFGRPREREKRERGGGGQSTRRRGGTRLLFVLLSPEALLYIGEGCTLPLPQGTKGGGQREELGQRWLGEVGLGRLAHTYSKTLTLAGQGQGPKPMTPSHPYPIRART
jgi:hypothetical protein